MLDANWSVLSSVDSAESGGLWVILVDSSCSVVYLPAVCCPLPMFDDSDWSGESAGWVLTWRGSNLVYCECPGPVGAT